MGYLRGLKEYIDQWYYQSIFDENSGLWSFHVHGHRMITAAVKENLTFDVKLEVKGQEEIVLPKIEIKFLYPADKADLIRPLLKVDEKVKDLGLEPIYSPNHRFFVKNKSLFPLIQGKEVVFFTLLEGEILRGIIAGFSRYEIIIHMKGGIPITILRHSIYDLRDKKGRCYLKTSQEKYRDWEKSDLFVTHNEMIKGTTASESISRNRQEGVK